MTVERVRQLIAGGESLAVEFKSEASRPFSDRELVEAVICLANRPGMDSGWLLLGVEDDGRVTGTQPRHGNTTDPLRLQALIANRTRPSLPCRVELVELEAQAVVVIEVPPARLPVGTTEGMYLRRAIPTLRTEHGYRRDSGASWWQSEPSVRAPGCGSEPGGATVGS